VEKVEEIWRGTKSDQYIEFIQLKTLPNGNCAHKVVTGLNSPCSALWFLSFQPRVTEDSMGQGISAGWSKMPKF
jgi:hypothetical protein